MKIEGDYTFAAPRERVWALLQDPDALSRALPGVERFEQVGPNQYEATIKAGVAAVRGVYHGRITMADLRPPEGYTLLAGGQGSTGTFEAKANIVLDEQDGRTRLSYDADAQVGGPIAGVGQRMLGGVAKLMAGQFCKAMEGQLAGQGGAQPSASPTAGDATAPMGTAPLPVPAATGALGDLLGLAGPVAPMAAVGAAGLLLGLLFGRRGRASDGRPAWADYELAAAMRDLASAIREQRRG